MNLYKSHVLTYLESNTAAYYHAAQTHLSLVDHVQEVLLRELHVTEEEALLHYNLAPLSTRRDCAMLGLYTEPCWGWVRLSFLCGSLWPPMWIEESLASVLGSTTDRLSIFVTAATLHFSPAQPWVWYGNTTFYLSTW